MTFLPEDRHLPPAFCRGHFYRVRAPQASRGRRHLDLSPLPFEAVFDVIDPGGDLPFAPARCKRGKLVGRRESVGLDQAIDHRFAEPDAAFHLIELDKAICVLVVDVQSITLGASFGPRMLTTFCVLISFFRC